MKAAAITSLCFSIGLFLYAVAEITTSRIHSELMITTISGGLFFVLSLALFGRWKESAYVITTLDDILEACEKGGEKKAGMGAKSQ